MDDFSSSKRMKPLLPCSSSSGKRTRPPLACSSHHHHHRDWSGLMSEILLSIMHRLPSTDDFVRFGAVCRPWRSVFLQQVSSGKAPLVPFLLVVPRPPEADQQRLLYSPSTKRVYDFRLRAPHNKVCRGSSFGWLVTIERLVQHTHFRMQLHNPFLDWIIDLPPPDDVLGPQPDEGDLNSNYPWDGYDLYKAVLSSNPSSSPDDFVVMAIMARYRGLAYFKPGNTTWTSLSIGGSWYTDHIHHCKSFNDVIFFHKSNQFYALLDDATVLAIDLLGDETGNPKFTQVAPHPPTLSHTFPSFPSYLAEDLSTGDLFLVYKQVCQTTEEDPASLYERIARDVLTGSGGSDPPITITMQFVVFKLDTACGMWAPIDDLGENIMFLGSNGSIVRSVSDCPGCEPSCVYYTDDAFHGSFPGYGPPFNGVYNLNDGTTQPHYPSTKFTPISRGPSFNRSRGRSTVVLPEAIWLEPTLKI